MGCEVESVTWLNHYYYGFCDQRTPRLQGCLGELATLALLDHVVHVIHTTFSVLWPFGSGNEFEVASFETFEQRHGIKKSQTRNCDTCSELKLKCRSS